MHTTFPAHTDFSGFGRKGHRSNTLARRKLPHELAALVEDGDEAVRAANS